MNTIGILRNLSLKLSLLDHVKRPKQEHWDVIHEVKSALGVGVSSQSTFFQQRHVLWEEIRKQAREQVCRHLVVGSTVRFLHKDRTIHSFTPTFKVVLECDGKKITANPLSVVPREFSGEYAYMVGTI